MEMRRAYAQMTARYEQRTSDGRLNVYVVKAGVGQAYSWHLNSACEWYLK